MKKVIYLIFSFIYITTYSQEYTYHYDHCDSDSSILLSKQVTLIVYDLINEYRAENGLNKLIIDTAGNFACESHNRYMHEDNNTLGHDEFDESNKYWRGYQPWHRYNPVRSEIACAQYYWGSLGSNMETVDYTKYDIAKMFLKSWKRSPGHNRAMLRSDIKYMSGYANIFVIHKEKEGTGEFADMFRHVYEWSNFATCTFY